jgi:hypothetical protein
MSGFHPVYICTRLIACILKICLSAKLDLGWIRNGCHFNKTERICTLYNANKQYDGLNLNFLLKKSVLNALGEWLSTCIICCRHLFQVNDFFSGSWIKFRFRYALCVSMTQRQVDRFQLNYTLPGQLGIHIYTTRVFERMHRVPLQFYESVSPFIVASEGPRRRYNWAEEPDRGAYKPFICSRTPRCFTPSHVSHVIPIRRYESVTCKCKICRLLNATAGYRYVHEIDMTPLLNDPVIRHCLLHTCLVLNVLGNMYIFGSRIYCISI